MSIKEQVMSDAWQTARNARRSAQYALNRLVAVADCSDPAECARLTEDAQYALEDGATDATLALAGFHRGCRM